MQVNKMHYLITLLLTFCLYLSFSTICNGQNLIETTFHSDWQSKKWDANWIGPTNSSSFDYTVQLFRKEIELKDTPRSFIIHLSADQRYEFFVNGVSVCRGPATGSLMAWNYESLDIGPYLTKGRNILAAAVVNYGLWTPGAQQTLFTAFILQGEGDLEKIANTDGSWKTIKNKAYSPCLDGMEAIDIEPGDIINGSSYPWGWQDLKFDDKDWLLASLRGRGQPFGSGTEYRRALQPRSIPFPEIGEESSLLIRRSEGMTLSGEFLKDGDLVIPPHSNVSIVLDQGYLTNSFIALRVSNGEGTMLKLTYAESLSYNDGTKGNRNEIDGKEIKGVCDKILIGGGTDRLFSPLNFKTFRYIEMKITTGRSPLVIHQFSNRFVGYPFKLKAYFKSNKSILDEIFQVGWRTARLCAVDTYYDCPYYERMQYTGDARIQGLISLYMTGDNRLMRKAIIDLASSITAEGILQSRYPAHYPQIIPSFSLYWINMLHDYWMHYPDEDFVRSQIPTVERIVSWFEKHMDKNTNMLGPLPHWNFVDWPNEWPWSESKPLGGVPPGAITGGSAIISLQLAYTLKDAQRLFTHFSFEELADQSRKMQNEICDGVFHRCFSENRKLMADDNRATSYSQHASIMGILSDAIPSDLQRTVMENLLEDPTLIKATVYYQFYLIRAMKKVGLANKYIASMGIWKDMLTLGLSTFAERPEPSRSDCHAWSASPNYDLLATVCGIEPALPNFKKVIVAPNLGGLSWVQAAMPHPEGEIAVELKLQGDKLTGVIRLPKNTEGLYRYNGEEKKLTSGDNLIK